MTIGLKEVILERGKKHNLGPRRNPPTYLQKAKRVKESSLNHVLPYRFPLLLGVMLEQFYGRNPNAHGQLRARFDPWEKDGIKKNADRGVQTAPELDILANQFINVAASFSDGEEVSAIRHRVAWAGPMIFQGPNVNLRLDDPSGTRDERERHRPLSFPPRAWRAVHDVGDAIESVVGSWDVDTHGGDISAILKRDITGSELTGILRECAPLVNWGRGNSNAFQASDWVVVTSTQPSARFTRTQVAPQYKASPGSFDHHRPVLNGGITHPADVLWRLEKETDVLLPGSRPEIFNPRTE